ncbi:XVIPCD domain-containing protein [Dyella koreensis]|uniref:X-Tfes XVIPCD domain-containing protein n=1 Tax=Dyella koreensis TaxID=311235 RepID=A0ABW8K3L1_9GAMM
MRPSGLEAYARTQAAMHGGDAAAQRQAAKTLSDEVSRTAGGPRVVDRLHDRDIGNIPVSRAALDAPETISPRSLAPVHRATHPDRAHEQQLLRDVALINERTERELGKAPLQQREVTELTRTHAQERKAPDHAMQRTAPAEAIQPDHPAKRVDEAKHEAAMAAPTASAPALPVQPAAAPVMRAAEPSHGVSPAADALPPAPALPTQIPEPHHSAGLTPPRQPEPEAGHLRESMAAPGSVHTSPFAENAPMAFRAEARRDEHRLDPNHPVHPDHAMHQGIRDHLVALHRDAGFTLAPDQMERLTASVLVEAKRSGLTDVTHMEFGEAVASGMGTPTIHVFQAFRGDLDDPRTEWGAVNAQQAMDVPLQHSHQQLQVVNQQLEQQYQYNQQWRMQEQQQQSMGPTMTV